MKQEEMVRCEQLWVPVTDHESLPDHSTRVLMFIRGVGARMGICTRAFEIPWFVCDPVWFGQGDTRHLSLDAVVSYINLDAIPVVIPISDGEEGK